MDMNSYKVHFRETGMKVVRRSDTHEVAGT